MLFQFKWNAIENSLYGQGQGEKTTTRKQTQIEPFTPY